MSLLGTCVLFRWLLYRFVIVSFYSLVWFLVITLRVRVRIYVLYGYVVGWWVLLDFKEFGGFCEFGCSLGFYAGLMFGTLLITCFDFRWL